MRTSPRILTLALSLSLGLTLVAPSAAQAGVAVVRNPGDPAYVTTLRTGGKGHTWVGTHAISFTNLDAAALDTIYLRTWSNGVLGCGAHSITVSSMEGGTVVDDTALACTEIEVTLDAPLAQGERTTLSMDLEIDVPARNDRFGYHNGLALMGTALPTLEVHDDQGWHHDPFIDLGESFYSIVGSYRVTLNTPEALDTPTSGVVASSTTPVPGRRETTYVAEDVRDFAWAAGRLRRVVGSSGDTRVVVSYQGAAISASEARTALRNAERSLDTFSSSFGTFPYREMDVVLAGFASFGGMEYPTIIFTNPDRQTVSHELAHQYWYGIVGDNEFAEPWLDESFATWSQFLPFGRMEQLLEPAGRPPGRHHERHGVLEHPHQPVLGDLRRRWLPARQPGAPVRHHALRQHPGALRGRSVAGRGAHHRLPGEDRGGGRQAPSRPGHGRLLGHVAGELTRRSWD